MIRTCYDVIICSFEVLVLTLDRESSIPLYHQLRDKLRHMIIDDGLAPYTRLPSESELCAEYGASRITVRLALTDLVNEGLIYREQGVGTFVAPPKISRRFTSLISFTEEIRSKGLEPSSKVLRAELTPAGDKVAEKLGIFAHDQVVVVERIRYAGGKPVGLNTSHLNYRLCPDILAEDLGIGSLYEIIERKYKLRINKAERTLESMLCPPGLAGILGIGAGEPILYLTGVAYVESGDALDYCEEYYAED